MKKMFLGTFKKRYSFSIVKRDTIFPVLSVCISQGDLRARHVWRHGNSVVRGKGNS